MMRDEIRYVNCNNEEVVFGAGHLHYGDTSVHDYEWSYTTVSNRIDTLKRGVWTFELLAAMRDGSIDERNRMTDVFDYDVREGTPGTLHIGDYRIECFCISSEKGKWWFDDGRMEAKLKFVTDSRYWKKTTRHEFYAVGGEVSDTGKMYPFGYPYDYASTKTVESRIDVSGRHAANWRLIVYGPAINPAVRVAGHLHAVRCTIEDGGYLVVDSERKTALLVGRKGTITNVFNMQDKSSYLFEKLPVGVSDVLWDNNFGFEFQVDEERSEPEWVV